LIEFVLSKVWAVICGLVLIGGLLISFGAMEESSMTESVEQVASDIASVLGEISDMPDGSFRIEMLPLLPTGHSLTLRSDSVLVSWKGCSALRPLSSVLTLMDHGGGVEHEVGSLLCTRNDVLRAEVSMSGEGRVMVHLEKT